MIRCLLLVTSVIIFLTSNSNFNCDAAKPGAASIGHINAQKSMATKSANVRKRRPGSAPQNFENLDSNESSGDENVTSLLQYAEDLFDLMAAADADNNGQITKKEHSDWSTRLSFSASDAQTQFDGMDKNGDGRVSIEEYFVWVNKFWTTSRPYIEQTFRDADSDFSGRISRHEYLNWYQSFNEISLKDIDLDFLDRDRNQDGVVTVEDFKMATFLKAADTDEDGFLSLEEYLGQTMRHLPSTLDKQRQRKKETLDFGEIDTDGDGFLSLQELEEDMV